MKERFESPKNINKPKITWEDVATSLSFNPEAAEKRIEFAKGKKLIESGSITGSEEAVHNWLTGVYDDKSFKKITPYRRYVSLLELDDDPIAFLSDSLEDRYSEETKKQYLKEIKSLSARAKKSLEQYKTYLDAMLEETPVKEPYGDEYDIPAEQLYKFRPTEFFEMGKRLIDRGLVKGHEGELKVWINSFEYNDETYIQRLFSYDDKLEGEEMYEARNYREYFFESCWAQKNNKSVEETYDREYQFLEHRQLAHERLDSVPIQAQKSLDYLAKYTIQTSAKNTQEQA